NRSLILPRNSPANSSRFKPICLTPSRTLRPSDTGFPMRFVHAAVLLAVSASPALAQRGPVIVIPGRPDVPILENGVDISWSVVEGEFGLDRPGQVTPTVIYRLPPPVIPTYAGAAATE